jgi:hypothetical protein
MHFCFVTTRRGSFFMTELLQAISAATAAAGHAVELAFDEFPPLREESVYVTIPHEFSAWGDPDGFPDTEQRARTIALCTENPGTAWFEETFRLVPEFALAVSINRSSAAELERRGLPCEHLQLGYTPLWDSWRRDESVRRPIDVLYLGAADPRRDPLLGGIGGELWARRCEFLIPPLEPRTGPRPDFLTGTEKYQRLHSAKILLNLHRTTSSALEWMRFLEAICNGCVVISEPCIDNEPLIPGEHFLAAEVDRIAGVVNRLLEEPERMQQLRGRAYDFVAEQLPMNGVGEQLAQLALGLSRVQPLQRGPAFATATISPAAPTDPRAASSPAPIPPASLADPRAVAPPQQQAVAAGSPPSALAERGRRLHASAREQLRTISRRSLRMGGNRGRPIAQTAAYAHSAPQVTVIGVLNGDGDGVDALASVNQTIDTAVEVLFVDETTRARAQEHPLRRFFEQNPQCSAALLSGTANGCLASARNMATGHARGEYVFMLDPSGGIYPSTLSRLVKALHADPEAIFAYPMIAATGAARPVQLLSSLPWEPGRLKCENWIDSMVLLRRRRLLELGGYCTDRRLAGFEDFCLWCKCAEAGAHAVHVPQILGWHPRSANSPAFPVPAGSTAIWELMRAHFPKLLTEPGEK